MLTFSVPDLKGSRMDDLWYVILLGLLMSSLLLSIKNRTQSLIKRGRKRAIRHFSTKRTLALDRSLEEAQLIVQHELELQSWKAPGLHTQNYYQVQRGNLGAWGSIVFHLGLFVTAAGLLIAILFNYEGLLMITEGETILNPSERMRIVSKGMLAKDPVQSLSSIELLRGREESQGTTEKKFTSHVLIDTDLEGSVYLNNPLELNKLIINQSKWGKTIGLVVSQADEVLHEGWIRLGGKTQGAEVSSSDYIMLGTGIRLDLELSGTTIQRSEWGGARSSERLNITFSQNTQAPVDAILAPGQVTQVNEYRVSFTGVRYWSQLNLSNVAGYPVMVLGFILITLGLTFRALFFHRVLVVSFTEGDTTLIEISASAEKFQYTHHQLLNTLCTNIRSYNQLAETVDVLPIASTNQSVGVEV